MSEDKDILLHHLGSIDQQLIELRNGVGSIRRELAEDRVATTMKVTRVATKVSALVGTGTISLTGLIAWALG